MKLSADPRYTAYDQVRSRLALFRREVLRRNPQLPLLIVVTFNHEAYREFLRTMPRYELVDVWGREVRLMGAIVEIDPDQDEPVIFWEGTR